jgi:hypothetical protein
MKRTTVLAMTLVGLALMGVALVGGYRVYQQHISSDVRAAVLAAVGDNATEADIVVYLRAAKLASRTKRDAEVVDLLDRGINAAVSSQKSNQESWKLLLHDLSNPIEPAECRIYGPVTSECIAALKASIEEHKRDVEVEKAYDANAKYESGIALDLLNAVRKSVGLEPKVKSAAKPAATKS